MPWQDSDNAGYRPSGYFEDPQRILSLSLPLFNFRGVRVRLHFWLLLVILLDYLFVFHRVSMVTVTMQVGLLILSLLVHELGHFLAARRMGLEHNQWMLWPCGGMIPPPAPPHAPGKFFVHAAGIAANLVVLLVCLGVLRLNLVRLSWSFFNPLAALSGLFGVLGVGAWATLAMISLGLIYVNLLPFYWFDGGPIWEAILQPWTGLFQAINVTCIAGMVIAAPMSLWSLYRMDVFGAAFWLLLFCSNFQHRRQLQRSGTGEFDEAVAYSATMGTDDSPRRRRPRVGRWGKSRMQRDAEARQKLEAKIDVILEKVSRQGMHSLSGREVRLLKQATQEQRRQAGE